MTVVLLMFVAPVHASEHMEIPKVFGFTTDGSTFVYVVRQEPSEHADLWHRGVLMDVRTAAVIRTYDFLYGVNPKQEEADFHAWLEKNPTRCQGGPRSSDGQSTLRIAYKGGDTGNHRVLGSWEKESYTFGATGVKEDGNDMYVEPWIVIHGFMQTAGREAPLFRWGGRGDWGLSGAMIPCWSADNRRIAVVFARRGSGMRNAGSLEVMIRPIQGPRVQVVLPRAAAPPLAEVANHLEAAGFILSDWRKTRERRPHRLKLQNAAGMESASRLIAARFFDGASFEKLPSAENFDIVVSLGPPIPPLRP
jgi:hypothetical protein